MPAETSVNVAWGWMAKPRSSVREERHRDRIGAPAGTAGARQGDSDASQAPNPLSSARESGRSHAEDGLGGRTYHVPWGDRQPHAYHLHLGPLQTVWVVPSGKLQPPQTADKVDSSAADWNLVCVSIRLSMRWLGLSTIPVILFLGPRIFICPPVSRRLPSPVVSRLPSSPVVTLLCFDSICFDLVLFDVICCALLCSDLL